MNELQECHELVWAFRKEIEPYWATPDPLNSLRYAFCEAAEAMDAWLRAERPEDSRNNERQNNVLDELADCAIMLLTVIPGLNSLYSHYEMDDYTGNLHSICFHVSRLLNDANDIVYFKFVTVISLIANYPGMELKQRIQGRLERIVKKHAPLDKQKIICEKVGIICLLAEEIKELRKQHLTNLGIANEPPM